jgi:hypothetical protein
MPEPGAYVGGYLRDAASVDEGRNKDRLKAGFSFFANTSRFLGHVVS